MHLPVGIPIHITLNSADALHSFWLPGLKRSVAIVPDKPGELDLTLASPGHFYGNCDAGCGCGTVCMRFAVFADNPGLFSKWATLTDQRNRWPVRLSGVTRPHGARSMDQMGERQSRLLTGSLNRCKATLLCLNLCEQARARHHIPEPGRSTDYYHPHPAQTRVKGAAHGNGPDKNCRN